MRRKRFRTARRVILAILVVLLAILAVFEWLVWNPRTSDPESADAIMVLSYRDDRMQKGRELAAEGVSDQLVVSRSERVRELFRTGKLSNTGSRWFEECDKEYDDYLAHCVVPVPNTTRGEAYAMAQLAQEEGWDSIVLVTEPSHLRRATTIAERCFDGTVYPVASDAEKTLERTLYRSFYEVGAYVMDLFRGNQCL